MQETVCEKILLEGRRKLQMTCVEAVDGFSEQTLKISVKGNKVIITGKNLKITAFSKESGNLSAEGEITDVKYGGEKQPFIKRIFK